MTKFTKIAAVLIATTALTTSVYALDQARASEKTIAQDVNKLSKDGFRAMMDIRDARLAIFNAQPDKAKTDIEDAQKALARAKTDDTNFIKAEDALKPPANRTAPAPADAHASKTPVAWLPVNGALGIDEDFTASPAKAAGVAKANTQLKNGQRMDALETLRLNDVSVSFVMQVVPLDKTVQGVDQAARQINDGKYYEANQTLKNVEEGLRYDVVEVTDRAQTPDHKAAAKAQTPGPTTGAAPATPPAATDQK